LFIYDILICFFVVNIFAYTVQPVHSNTLRKFKILVVAERYCLRKVKFIVNVYFGKKLYYRWAQVIALQKVALQRLYCISSFFLHVLVCVIGIFDWVFYFLIHVCINGQKHLACIKSIRLTLYIFWEWNEGCKQFALYKI
jgi:hypothetical protein